MSKHASQTNYAVQLNRANGRMDIVPEWTTRQKATKMALGAVMMMRTTPPAEPTPSVSVVDFDGKLVETFKV